MISCIIIRVEWIDIPNHKMLRESEAPKQIEYLQWQYYYDDMLYKIPLVNCDNYKDFVVKLLIFES